MPKKATKTEDKKEEIKLDDFISVKQKETNSFFRGKVSSIDENKLEITDLGGNINLFNRTEIEPYKMRYGQKFDIRELPENYKVSTKEDSGNAISIGEIPYNDVKCLIYGKKTEGIYLLKSEKTGEQYEARLQLTRENGRLNIAPSFKNKEELNFKKSYNLSDQQVDELKKGNVVKTSFPKKGDENNGTFEAYLKLDKNLNRVDYVTANLFEKQLEVVRNPKIKKELENLTEEQKQKMLSGKLKITVDRKIVSYDFRNANFTTQALKVKEAKKQDQKQTKAKSQGVS